MSENNKQERPLSPHLQVYKPQMTSMLSILHRMTGVILVFGLMLLTYGFIAAASGPQYYGPFTCFLKSTLGQIGLIGMSFGVYYHMCNGIRHLIWDTGRLFNIINAKIAGYVVLFTALALMALTWGYVYYG